MLAGVRAFARSPFFSNLGVLVPSPELWLWIGAIVLVLLGISSGSYVVSKISSGPPKPPAPTVVVAPPAPQG